MERLTVRIDLDGDTPALMLPLRDVSEFFRKLFAGPRTRLEGCEHSSPWDLSGKLRLVRNRTFFHIDKDRVSDLQAVYTEANISYLGDGDDLAHPEIDSTRSGLGALSSGSYNLGRHAGYIPARSREDAREGNRRKVKRRRVHMFRGKRPPRRAARRFDSQFDSHGLGQGRMKRTCAVSRPHDSFRFGRQRTRFNGT